MAGADEQTRRERLANRGGPGGPGGRGGPAGGIAEMAALSAGGGLGGDGLGLNGFGAVALSALWAENTFAKPAGGSLEGLHHAPRARNGLGHTW